MIFSKNVTLVTSIISSNPNTRENRFHQIKHTIMSIREKIPDNIIVLVECSPLTTNEVSFFKENIDIFLNIHDNKDDDIVSDPNLKEDHSTVKQQLIRNIYSQSPSLSEGTLTIYALAMLFSTELRFGNFFKISGGYWCNECFDYGQYCNDQIVVKYIETGIHVDTTLYKLPYNKLIEWYYFLKKSSTDFANCEPFGIIFAKFIQKVKMVHYQDNIVCEIPELSLSCSNIKI